MTEHPPRKNRRSFPLHVQIGIALALAVIVGAWANAAGVGDALVPVLDFLGQMFLRLLKMLIVPLIFSSIVVGVAGVEKQQGMGRLGLATAMTYLITSMIAIVLGLFMVLWIQPGIIDGRPARDLIGLTADLSSVLAQVEGKRTQDMVDIFLRMVPENIVMDAARGEMLSVIVFALLFGLALNHCSGNGRDTVVSFFRGVDEVMLNMTHGVLMVSPIGVFALVCKIAITTGFDAIRPLAWFVVTVLFALAFHAFVVIPSLLTVLGYKRPGVHFKTMIPAFLMAFSTASSAGTLPVTMECAKKLGLSDRVTSFTLPIGASVNMDGTALYECVAAVFIAQAYGLQLGFSQLFIIALIALVSSVGVAGIPAASLVAISLILSAMGLPLEGLGLILAVDRLLDMCRTTVNVLGDSAVASIVERVAGGHASGPGHNESSGLGVQ